MPAGASFSTTCAAACSAAIGKASAETWTAADRRGMTLAERAALAREIAAATREREPAARAVGSERQAHRALWAQSVPVTAGDPVHRYLCRRLALDVFDGAAVPATASARSTTGTTATLGTFPAMVAPLIAPDGRTCAASNVLDDDGHKADVRRQEADRRFRAAGRREHPPALAGRGVIGVAEGIETALAASLASGVPTVAAYCANGLAGFHGPGVQRLVIFADNDRAGREAAAELSARALRAWLSVNVDDAERDGATGPTFGPRAGSAHPSGGRERSMNAAVEDLARARAAGAGTIEAPQPLPAELLPVEPFPMARCPSLRPVGATLPSACTARPISSRCRCWWPPLRWWRGMSGSGRSGGPTGSSAATFGR